MAKKKSILIVDDSPTVRRLVELIMSQEGYTVLTAEDGDQGLKIASENNPSLLLVDFLMPKMNGYQFCKIVRSKDDLKHIPIILITAKGEDVASTFEERFGVIEYFQKPFEPDELVQKVNEVMGRSEVETVEAAPEEVAAGHSLSMDDFEDAMERVVKKYFKYEMQVMLKNLIVDTLKEMELSEKENLLFSGQIKSVTMPDILQFIDNLKLTGKLSVLSPSLYSEVYIENGMIVFATLSKKGYHKFVTDLIVEDGKITKEELARVLKESKNKNMPVGKVIVEYGYLTEDELMSYLRRMAEDAFFMMIEASSGNFYFEASPIPMQFSDIKFRIPMPGIILDGLRRFDEKKVAAEALSDDTVVLARLITNADEIESIEMDQRELAVFSQINGKRSLREIIDKSGMDELEVKRICYSLQKVGLLKIKTAERSKVWQGY
ncbi:MAG: response regulator [Nitrospirota bacterium]|nr:MAG: response regulator [Nitrospirota bacterium]